MGPCWAWLLERSATACDLPDRLFSSQASFDPATGEAPGIRFTFQQTTPAVVENTATVLSTVDGLLMPHGIIDGFPAVDLSRTAGCA